MRQYIKTLLVAVCGSSLTLINSACSPKSQKSNYASVSDEELKDLQKAELEALINEQIEKRDESGNIQELEGFTKTDKLDGGNENLLAVEDFRDLSQSDEQIFEFVPPAGVEAEFSEPVMISGASLFLTAGDLDAKCEALAYQVEEPTMKQILEYSQKTNTCGDVSVSFCIRLKLAQQINPEQPNYTYTESPSLDLNLPCPEDSFNDLSIKIANDKSHTVNSSEKIEINAIRSVLSVYLSNSPGFFEGGEWRDIEREDPTWNLEFIDGVATVYAKFLDVFGAESECISDSIGYGSTTEQCFADDSTYLVENILAGVSIGDLEGTASTDYPECTSDGQVGCIASSTYKAASADGMAAKLISGQTAGGISGSVALETHSNCSSGGQEDCIATSTYKSMDLASKDAGGAVDITNALFSARVKASSTFEFWDETGTRYTSVGDEDIVEANLADGVDIFGVTGTAGETPDCSSIAVGGTWILVPGDADYGTNDFCVMKYEAKNSSNVPTSTAADTPWVSIDQQDAITECASLGKGFHLISNDEWMTIAANAANVGSNWSNGAVDDAELARGHSDNNPTQACEADASDANAYVETNCSTRASTGTFNQRRTMDLSNGEVIWDLAGNVWEWTRYFNSEDKPTPVGDAWGEFTAVTGTSTMPLSDLIPTNAVKSFWDNNWDSTESIGRYYPGNNSSGGALRRGGVWLDTTDVGIFTAHMFDTEQSDNIYIGFRCTVAVP